MAGAAATGRIPGEGRRGTVGQRRLGHEGGAADRYEGKRGQETHRMSRSMVAELGRWRMTVRGQGRGRWRGWQRR
jgi:hypothetical protein